jgi:hypothetical protein
VARVLAVIRRPARTTPRLASDDVWAELDGMPDLPPQYEPRAFAAAVRPAEAGGLIRVTAETRPTRLARAHRRPIHVWVSTSLARRRG